MGAYYVNHPGTVTDQVDWFLQILDEDVPWWRDHPCFILQIDAERFSYMSRAPSFAEIEAFGDQLVAKTGLPAQRVLAYAPEWLYHDTLAGLSYPLWASDYGSNPVGHYPDVYPGNASARWAPYSGQVPLLLQYGSNTIIAGQTTCDANAYRGSLAQLLSFFQASPTQQEADMLRFTFAADIPGIPADRVNRVHCTDGLRYSVQQVASDIDALKLAAGAPPIKHVTKALLPTTGGVWDYPRAVKQLCGTEDPGELAGADGGGLSDADLAKIVLALRPTISDEVKAALKSFGLGAAGAVS